MKIYLTILTFSLLALSCSSEKESDSLYEAYDQFIEVGELQIKGGDMAAEISAFEPSTGLLFVTNNAIGNRVDVIDLKDPANPIYKDSIQLKALPETKAMLNSVSVKNGLLAVAVSDSIRHLNGKVFIFETKNFSLLKELEVGALPDMITFSPDGNYIVVANEGEPDSSYTFDPKGSVSIIEVNQDFQNTTVEFDIYNDSTDNLAKKGFRVFGPNADLAKDIEPEYVAIAEDSKTAYVTLQENNGIAVIDLKTKRITAIFGLGFKDFNAQGNEIDVCDEDHEVTQSKWPIKGIYQPDAIEFFETTHGKYLLTANEGDGRNYPGYSEETRIANVKLDPESFPDSATFKACEKIGRLIITTTLGDTDGDGDFDELYTFGARSFSLWDATTGELVVDSRNRLETDLIANSALYDDMRSDDRGIEPEGVAVGTVNGITIGVIGLERANAVLTYDLTEPLKIRFLQVLETGIGPEGIIFVNKEQSPNGRSMLIVSSEVDGKIKIYQPQLKDH